MDRYPENDPVERRTDSTYVSSSTDSGVTWFIVGALVIAAGVLAYLYFGDDEGATTATDTTIEAPADPGRASTPDAAPPADTAPPADMAPAPAEPAEPAPPADMAPPADTAPPAPNPAQ